MPKYVQFVPLKLIETNWAEEFPGATAIHAGDPVSVAGGGIFGCDEVFNRIRMVCEVHWNISIYLRISMVFQGHGLQMQNFDEFLYVYVVLLEGICKILHVSLGGGIFCNVSPSSGILKFPPGIRECAVT